MNHKQNLGISILLVISLTLSACDISITINPTSQPSTTDQQPSPSINTPTPSASNQPEHELYAGFTGNNEIPFLIIHPSGEKVGITENNDSPNITGAIWESSTGDSIVVHMDTNGYPESAVVGDEIILYSNYTSKTVDLTIIHPDGTRELYRSTINSNLLNKTALVHSSYNEIDFLIVDSHDPLQQNIWGYIDEGLFAIEIATCAGAAVVAEINIAVLAALAVACHGPLLELKIREGKAENIDVGNLEVIQDGLDLYGCYSLDFMSCINKYVRDMAEKEEAARQQVDDITSVEVAPDAPVTPKPKECKGKYSDCP